MPYSSLQEAVNYHPAASGDTNAPKATDVLEDAGDLVARYTEAPDAEAASSETLEDYASRAARAERRVFAYLWDTGGYIRTENISGAVSTSYGDMSGVLAVIRDIMGDYYTGSSGAAASTAYVTRWR